MKDTSRQKLTSPFVVLMTIVELFVSAAVISLGFEMASISELASLTVSIVRFAAISLAVYTLALFTGDNERPSKLSMLFLVGGICLLVLASYLTDSYIGRILMIIGGASWGVHEWIYLTPRRKYE